MSTIDSPAAHDGNRPLYGIEIRMLNTADEMVDVAPGKVPAPHASCLRRRCRLTAIEKRCAAPSTVVRFQLVGRISIATGKRNSVALAGL